MHARYVAVVYSNNGIYGCLSRVTMNVADV